MGLTRSEGLLAAAAGAGAVAAVAVARHSRRPAVVWAPGSGAAHHGALFARVVGGGRPEAVLLHGLGGSNRYWGAAYDPLAGPGSLVVPDLLGFGRSDHPADGYGPSDHADALAACLLELGADRPVLVGAHSLGCVVALGLARRHPDLVDRVVGFGPPVYPDRATAQARISHLGFLERQIAYGLPWAERTCQWMCEHRVAAARIGRLMRPSLPWPIVQDGVEHTWASYSRTFSEVLLAGPDHDLLDGVAVPVTLVAGLSDLVPDRSHLHQLAGRHPNLRVVERPGDHDLPLTDPGWCMGELLRRRRMT